MPEFPKLPSLLLLLATLPSLTALAADQPHCGIPETIRSGLVKESGYLPKEKSSSVGTVLKRGGVLFYLSMAEARRYYVTAKGVSITDRSPLNPNFDLEPGQKYPVVASLTLDNRDRDELALIDISSGMFKKGLLPVKVDGFACSDLIGFGIDKSLSSVGMPTTHQEEPLQLVTEELAGGKKKSVSIVVKELDDGTATLEITGMVNGVAAKRRSMSVDLLAGNIELSGLVLTVERKAGEIRVKSVEEPLDYGVWMRRMTGL